MDTVGWFWDVMNLIFLAIIPLIVKFLNDVKKIYIELKTDITEHKVRIDNLMKDIEDLKEDIKELRKLIDSLSYDLKNRPN